VELGEGYSSLNDVNAIPPPRRDHMESFWLVSHPETEHLTIEITANKYAKGGDSQIFVPIILAGRSFTP
jgi:hypothetical protein